MSTVSATTVTFPSQEQLEKAVYPFKPDEVAKRTGVKFRLDPKQKLNKTVPFPHKVELLQHRVYRSNLLSVYMPNTPLVPGHLAIALNRTVSKLERVTEEENEALMQTVVKIQALYRKKKIESFVFVETDRKEQFIAQLIPHPTGHQEIKNGVWMVARNLHTHCPNKASLRTFDPQPAQESEIAEWREAFANPVFLEHRDPHQFPFVRYESGNAEGRALIFSHFLQLMEQAGGNVSPVPLVPPLPMPKIEEFPVSRCPFCVTSILERQRILSYETIDLLLNQRTYGAEGTPDRETAFLIIPREHREDISDLTEQERADMLRMQQVLVELLKEDYPDYEEVCYVQNGSSSGQTVFHNHMQVVAIHPDRGALAWTLMSLDPTNVSDEEITKVREKLQARLEKKLRQEKEQPLAM